MRTRLATFVALGLCSLLPVVVGCDDTNEKEVAADPGAKMRQTVGARLIAPGESTPGIEMLVSLPANYDAKTALEAVSPVVHEALKDCAAGGKIEVAPGGAAMMAVEVEGTKVLSADAAKGSGLECAAGKIGKVTLPKPLPKKVRLMLLLRPFQADAGTGAPAGSAAGSGSASASASASAGPAAAPQ